LIRRILATLLGLAVGVGLVAAFDALSHLIQPPPAGVNPTDTEASGAYIATLPASALLTVVAGWVAAALAGCLVASWVGRARGPGVVVGVLLLAATVLNLAAFRHPTWMVVTGLAGLVVGALVGLGLGARCGACCGSDGATAA